MSVSAFNCSKKMPNERAKVKGQPVPYTDMHGRACGRSDFWVHPHPLGQTPVNQYNPKNVTQAHPSMPLIPKYSIVPDTHTYTRTHTHAHTIK